MVHGGSWSVGSLVLAVGYGWLLAEGGLIAVDTLLKLYTYHFYRRSRAQPWLNIDERELIPSRNNHESSNHE